MKYKNKSISVDYDSTLNVKSVEHFIKTLMNEGLDVYICTSRGKEGVDFRGSDFNDDLYETAKTLSIPKDKIIFTTYELKYSFLESLNVILHIDDDSIETDEININTDIVGICIFNNKDWKTQVLELLN